MTKLIAIYMLGLVMGTLLGLTIAFIDVNLHEQNGRTNAEESYVNSLNDNSELLREFSERMAEYRKRDVGVKSMGVKTLVEIDMDGARKALAVAGYIRDWKQGSDDEIKSILFNALGCYGVKETDTNFVEQKVYDKEFTARKDAELKAFKFEKELNNYKKAVDQIQTEIKEDTCQDYKSGLRRAIQVINSSVSEDSWWEVH